MRFIETDTSLSDLRLLMDIKREMISNIIFEKPYNWILTNHIEASTLDLPSVFRVLTENEFLKRETVKV